ncbi:hypothetical protein AVME950_12580 [Acidovorax sp. SUPP950]|uniref:hypothetical protein n=1 Tax=unclassified Acidovorax TaxID=2684926 RepID=UPI00234BE8FC|nr:MULTISPECIES: hypothetical protein [Comamonadaceae]WCM99051.1 hypothetical protein M5C96_06355 [Acidovorax sp. GBBC 1281]WOI47567.1 hypothetical protein R1Z03_10305 [Paracidovorax avenae]GKS75734.1 hypothetical protein AVME950_12580 [Acidovorax sp. SUPP950]GKS82685.1 hypothetical protein AVMA1855_01055 [Acidovorax sp. SUPP1855]GKS90397.1 hypothetical protein AVTE2539_13550 [Acidovorax sp. SUPP2539]
MARNSRDKDEWAGKVFALIQGGNTQAAIAQVKVAPSVNDVVRLQAMLARVPASPARRQLDQIIEEERGLLSAPRLHRSP